MTRAFGNPFIVDPRRRFAHVFPAPPSPFESRRLFDDLNARAVRLRPVAVDRPLVLYGAGELGKLARSHLDIVGVPIALVVDANADAIRTRSEWSGLDVMHPSDVSARVKQDALLAVSIVNSRFGPLYADLTDQGWNRCVPFYDIAEGFRAKHPLSNGWFADALDFEHLGLCKHAADRWADDTSRAHHLRFAAWRLAREEWDFAGAPVDPSNRFFIDEVLCRLTGEERVLDAGAHHGTYLARFLMATGSKLSAAWAIEPDPTNRSILLDWVQTLEPELQDRLTILDEIVGARSKAVNFHTGLGYASQIAPSGAVKRRSCSIDSLNLDPTIVKLHVEGAELASLEGARETILRCRPILMATTYHNDDGLARTPLWCMTNLPNYRVTMRTHSWCGTGAVVYAIPKERLVRV